MDSSWLDSTAKSSYKPPEAAQFTVPVEWVRNTDGSLLLDHANNPISVDRMLATKPLRHELSTRPGPGNRKLTYLSGEGVTRTLNDIFGYDGWNLEIKSTKREEFFKDEQGRFHVAFTATVRLTHRRSGAYKEDCGAGDATDRSMGTAVANAMKASVTDAMKRSARHFGDKLGNSLYDSSFTINTAPKTLKDALDQYDKERAKTKFGPQKSQDDAEKARALARSVGVSGGYPTTGLFQALPIVRSNPDPPKADPKHATGGDQSSSAESFFSHSELSASKTNQSNNSTTISQVSTAKPAVPIGSKAPRPTNVACIGTPRVCDHLVSSVTPANDEALQPPPTPNQGLQSSNLFGLSMFAAGSKRKFNPSATATGNFVSMGSSGELASQRPTTSTGPRKSDTTAPPFCCQNGPLAHKRQLILSDSSDEAQQPVKKHVATNNPYMN